MKYKTTLYPVHEFIQKRYSPKAYEDKPISAEVLNSLFEAARWAPSSHNKQPWKFFYAHKSDTEKFNLIVNGLNESNQIWAKDAAVLIVALTVDLENNAKAAFDLGTATAYLNFQALENGIFMRHMGGFNKEILEKNFSFPEGLTPFVVLALGYPGSANLLPGELKNKELSPQERKNFDDLFV